MLRSHLLGSSSFYYSILRHKRPRQEIKLDCAWLYQLGPTSIKLFKVVIYKFTNIDNNSKYLSLTGFSSLVYCFWGLAGAYPRTGPPKGALLGQALALLTSIRLGWKRHARKNTLAYYVANIQLGLKGLPVTNILAYYVTNIRLG